MDNQKLVRIKAVRCVGGYRVELEFTDATKRVVDLEPYLHGPVFEPIRNNPTIFQSVHVDTRVGTIVWSNGADIDPDVLYYGLTPAWMEMAEVVTP